MRRLGFASPVAVLLSALLFLHCSKSSTSVLAPTASKCDLTATESPASFAAAGGAGTVAIATARDCTWSIAANASWVSVAAQDGQGPASVAFNVAPNPAPAPRSSTLAVGTQQVPVNQAGAPCQYRLSRSADAVSADGGPLSLDVTTMDGCQWTAASDAAWLAVTRGGSGSGSGTVAMSVAANPDAARVGHVNIAGQTYTVSQAAAAPNGGGGGGGGTTVQLVGTVTNVSGKCPALTITVSGTVVVTTTATAFVNGRCADVKKNETLGVTGTEQPNGKVLATQIDFKGGDDDH